MSFLRDVVQKCDAAEVPVSLCGEAAGGPLEAMALVGLGFRQISMNAAAIGPVKMMIRSLDIGKLSAFMAPLYGSPEHSLREQLAAFAEAENVRV